MEHHNKIYAPHRTAPTLLTLSPMVSDFQKNKDTLWEFFTTIQGETEQRKPVRPRDAPCPRVIMPVDGLPYLRFDRGSYGGCHGGLGTF